MSEEGEVRITLRDVYEAVTSLSAKLDSHKADIDGLAVRHQIQVEQSQDFEQRLRKLERWSYAIPTTFVLSAFSTIGVVLAAVLGGRL